MQNTSKSSVAEWLISLGMSEYADSFAQNDIDLDVLPELTDQDLERLGVSLGHRRKILRAIRALSSTTSTDITAAPAPKSSVPLDAAAGERRYVTVMFCDLVGSTEICARLDAEEWRDLVGEYLDGASAAVTAMGGHVAKKLGDGLLALFGYPVAHENDTERAVRAALAIHRSLGQLNRKNCDSGKPMLKARIGLETGPVVVDSTGEIFGDAPNVAARVQSLAEPGTLLATASVQRHVAGLFIAEDRGAHALKGVPKPTLLFRLVRASGGGRRSGARQLSPFVGRDDEIAMLIRRWERTLHGDGQFVTIVGEPGLGKSRLLEEFHARLKDTPHTWVEWSCSQLLQNTPLHPIAEWGRIRFGGADIPADQRLAELEGALSQAKLDPAENVPLLAPLVDIPHPGTPALAPQELRRRQLAASINWVMAGARAQRLVLACEDLHWADPTTIDLMRGIAERGALAPLFVVATTRPEFRPSWNVRSHHCTIALAPLDRSQVLDMMAQLCARHALAREMVDNVAARTGGVPLFVEEVTRLLLDPGQGDSERIPPTLQQSLMARLDRLGSAREVAQVASVIGHGFSYGLLRALVDIEEAALQAALERLAEADLLLVEGMPPQAEYRFKHALIQDAAYENLLKSRRQILHRRIGEVLRDRFPEVAAAQPEVLAHHFTQAGLTEAAMGWWAKAGEQALRRCAFQEATSHLGKAIEMADKAAAPRASEESVDVAEARRNRLKLQISYGQALLHARGYSAPETTAAYTRALELTADIGEPSERFSIYFGLWAGSFVRGELAPLREITAIMLRESETLPGSTEELNAVRLSGNANWFAGDFVEARVYLERAFEMFYPLKDINLTIRFAQDLGVATMTFLSYVLWLLGELDRSREMMDESLARVKQVNHVGTTVYALNGSAVLALWRKDAAGVKFYTETVVELSRTHNLPMFAAWGAFLEAWSRWQLSGRNAGLDGMRNGIAACRAQGNGLHLPLLMTALAEAEAHLGELDAAFLTIGTAIEETELHGQRWFEAETRRIRGEILLRRDPTNTEAAEEAFGEALWIAQKQKARVFELRAATDLARLWRDQQKRQQARDLLAPVYDRFSGDVNASELREARALLGELYRSSTSGK
jgi:class 3 adenylate cyclase/predicted ATPase